MNNNNQNATVNRCQASANKTKTMKVKKVSSSAKENVLPTKKVRRALSTDQAEQIIGDIKANATKTFSNVKSTFDNLTQKLRRSSRARPSAWRCQSYEEFDNAAITPVKLYSPFGIVTPSPQRANTIERRQRQQTPNIRRQQTSGNKRQQTPSTRRRQTPKRIAFVSPTGKLKRDVEELSLGLKELHTVAHSLRERDMNRK